MIDLSKATEDQETKLRVQAGICDKYLSSERHYHGIKHILDLNNKLEDYIREESSQFRVAEVKLAVAMHDVVYDLPNFGESNESKSCFFFRKYVLGLLPSLANNIDVHLVMDLIQSTEHFNPDWAVTEEDEFEFLLLHDLDFSPLGGHESSFKQDSINIRKEHWYVSDRDFLINRVKFLQTMLSRDNIYLLPYFQEKYEEQAKKNLTNALEEIES